MAWFVAADVCRVLGLGNPTMALEGLDEDEKTLSTAEGFGTRGPGANLISESGLYALILRSRKPAALKFRLWVTGEVLPALRRGRTCNTTPMHCNFHCNALPPHIPMTEIHWSTIYFYWSQCIQ